METAISAKRKRDELKATRNLPFEGFLRNPANTYLALEIKTIEDQVAECAKQFLEKIDQARYRLPEEHSPPRDPTPPRQAIELEIAELPQAVALGR